MSDNESEQSRFAATLVGFALGVVTTMVYYGTGGHVGFAVAFVALAWAVFIDVRKFESAETGASVSETPDEDPR